MRGLAWKRRHARQTSSTFRVRFFVAAAPWACYCGNRRGRRATGRSAKSPSENLDSPPNNGIDKKYNEKELFVLSGRTGIYPACPRPDANGARAGRNRNRPFPVEEHTQHRMSRSGIFSLGHRNQNGSGTTPRSTARVSSTASAPQPRNSSLAAATLRRTDSARRSSCAARAGAVVSCCDREREGKGNRSIKRECGDLQAKPAADGFEETTLDAVHRATPDFKNMVVACRSRPRKL
jgi:hypothetical protein